MKNIKDPLFPGNVDRLPENLTLTERFRNAGVAVFLGIVFVHIFFHGSMIFARIAAGEAAYWFKNPYFLAFLGLCALFGWFKGQKFTKWVYKEIRYLKFW